MPIAAASATSVSFVAVIATGSVVLVALVVGLFQFRTERMRHNFEIQKLLLERDRDEAVRHATSDRANPLREDASPQRDPLPAGQYLVVSYDADEQLPLFELHNQVQRVVLLVAAMLTLIGEPDDELRDLAQSIEVRRLHYGSPFEVVLIIQGVQAGIGALVGVAVGVNAAVQKMRRSWTETKRMRSEDLRDASRADLERLITDQLQGIVKGQIQPEQLARLTDAAEGLRSITFREVEGPKAIEANSPGSS